ncbi:MAG TPA: hypothetical protein G4O04_10640 [Anaerolineae bacterium]|nr:hypothetical protein [Anaerolineae bacterium]HID85117.1 hypothetical protein [Anaerolineales bacterium]
MRSWKKSHFFGLGLLILVTLLSRLLPGPRIIDDAYITFRYARNIVAGLGPVYNPGEPILGTTTPLYTALLALMGSLAGGAAAPFPLLALAFNAFCDAITVTILVTLGRLLGRPWVGWATALTWAILPFSVTFAIGGMETSLFVLLLTLTVGLYATGRTPWAALTLALGLLTRPEAALWALLMAADWLWRLRRGEERAPWWAPVLAFGLPLALWTGLATAYYGSPLPLSVSAKRVAYLIPPKAALIRFLQHFATPFEGHRTLGIPWIGVGLVLYPSLFLIGARHLLPRTPRLWPWALFPWGYLAAYALANPLIFRWYLTPPLPPYLFFIWGGLSALTRTLRPPLKATVRGILTAGVLFLVLRGWTWHPDHGPQTPAPRMAWFKLEQVYHSAAAFLQPYLRPGDMLAAADIGTLGYDTQAYIFDTLGLVSPQALAYYPLSKDQIASGMNYAVPVSLIRELRPDYAVFLEVYIRHTLLSDPWFRQHYETLAILYTDPQEIYNSHGMYIFRRRPQP